CLYYDGVDDYVNHVNVNFSEGSPHTYSAWVKWSGSAPTASIVPFGGTGSCDFIQLYSSGSYTFMFRDHSPCTQTTITNSNTQTLYNEKWHFITWSINSSKQLFFYIDGLKNGDTMTLVNSAIYYNWIAKGYSATGFLSNYLWKGYIDEVRIFDAAMPTSQIEQMYFAGLSKLFAKNQITQSEYQQRLANLPANNFAKE
ncbi:MAG: LamG domain-containing protein, partial [Candidatus Paceibacterota bacterium]